VSAKPEACVRVAVAAPVPSLYSYLVPESLVARVDTGSLIEVPFGRGRKRALVVEGPVPPGDAEKGFRLKAVASLVEEEPVLDAALLKVLRWSADYYLVPPGEMIFAALPPMFRHTGRSAAAKRRQLARVLWPALRWPEAETLLRRAPAQARLWTRLKSGVPIEVAALEQELPGARNALKGLVDKGLVAIEWVETLRAPELADLPKQKAIKHLTEEQAGALDHLTRALDDKGYGVFVLHGVTGSGKTEVYLRAIAHALSQDRGAILLVPEISLTPQLVFRVKARFGDGVAVLHSGLGAGERLDEWRRLRQGKARVVVGARSAVFAPVHRLGMIVVDEEHDGSYKQSERLTYNGRDLALVRAREEGAVVLLGSATPAIETYANARSGRYTLLELPERVHARPMPDMEVVDLRQVLDPIEREQVLSPALAGALAETLDRGEQAILFLNRRGYSSFALCKDCGETVRCRNCSVALTHHQRGDLLCCHYCGLSMKVPKICPSCGRGRIQLFGLGTEKCEEEVRRRFPGARVLRLDSDSVSGKGSLQDMMGRFTRGEADVLVGTQMVTKGHDVPGVTLVGVILADLSIQLPDFRANERSFQLLTQVAGRAGRGDRPGRVIVQSFLPDHESIVLARAHDFETFFLREMERRAGLGYPPARRLLLVRASHEERERCVKLAKELAALLRRFGEGRVQVLGPAPSPLDRLRNRYRWQMLVKSPSVELLQRVAWRTRQAISLPAGAKILFDVDPVDML